MASPACFGPARAGAAAGRWSCRRPAAWPRSPLDEHARRALPGGGQRRRTGGRSPGCSPRSSSRGSTGCRGSATGAEVTRFELRNGRAVRVCQAQGPERGGARRILPSGPPTSPPASSRRPAPVETNLGAHHHRAVRGKPEVGDRARGVACHGDEQRLAPAAHARRVGRRDRDLGDEVGGVLEVEVALAAARACAPGRVPRGCQTASW